MSSNTPASYFSVKKARNAQHGGGMIQLKLCGPKANLNAPAMMDVDFLHSHCLLFSLAEDPKLGPNYKPPGRDLIGDIRPELEGANDLAPV
jgi:hypothetical protein